MMRTLYRIILKVKGYYSKIIMSHQQRHNPSEKYMKILWNYYIMRVTSLVRLNENELCSKEF